MPRLTSILTTASACVLAASSTSGSAHPDDKPRTVLVIVAHPDDELFMAPAIAGEARSGSRVVIVYATSGDAGPGVSGMEQGEALALKRRQEALCAADALGAAPVYLEFGDGMLSTRAGRSNSTAARLREAMREQIFSRRPKIIMTWGPDGGYGHADHRMVSALAAEVVQSLDADVRPDLLYSGIVEGRMPDETPFGRWAGTSPDLLTVSYSYNEQDLARSTAAAQCHETQFDAASRTALIPFLDQLVWQGQVSFREAF